MELSLVMVKTLFSTCCIHDHCNHSSLSLDQLGTMQHSHINFNILSSIPTSCKLSFPSSTPNQNVCIYGCLAQIDKQNIPYLHTILPFQFSDSPFLSWYLTEPSCSGQSMGVFKLQNLNVHEIIFKIICMTRQDTISCSHLNTHSTCLLLRHYFLALFTLQLPGISFSEYPTLTFLLTSYSPSSCLCVLLLPCQTAYLFVYLLFCFLPQ